MNSSNNISTNFKNLKNITISEIILVVLIILYLISNVSIPYELAPYVNNVYTYFSLIAIVILLFLNSNPIIALFFGIAALVFVTRSNDVDNGAMAPSTYNNSLAMLNLNTNTNTNTNTNINSIGNSIGNSIMNQTSLEEELIGSIQKQPDNIINTANYHPVSCETHDASLI